MEDKISSATFWCLFGILLEDKKSCMTFCRPFFSFGRQKVTKRTAKSRAAFFCPPIWSATKKRQQKVKPRSFWSAKGRHGEKDGKKSWHLRSPFLTSYYYIDPKVVDPRSTRVNLVCSIELAHIAFCLSR